MSSVESSTLEKQFLVLGGVAPTSPVGPNANYEWFVCSVRSNIADAISDLNYLQTNDDGYSYYIVEALTATS